MTVSVGKNIRRLRMVAGLPTQKAFAKLLGVQQSLVSDWEHDRYGVLSISSLIKLAKVLDCSVDQLLAGVDPDYDRIREDWAVAAVSARTLPDIPVVAEGDVPPEGMPWNGRERDRSEVLRWLSRPGDVRDPKAYGIQIRGDSMLPAYWPNMIVIVSPREAARDRDEVYLQLASGECLVRHLHTCRGGYLLQPYNPAHKPHVVSKKEIKTMHVVMYTCRGALLGGAVTSGAVRQADGEEESLRAGCPGGRGR